jgi:NAD(P)-dependent dehydrogenase (short-subunit alcohol dehydrogenase family)
MVSKASSSLTATKPALPNKPENYPPTDKSQPWKQTCATIPRQPAPLTSQKKTFNRLDVLVNAAGNTERCSIEDTTVEAYHRLYDVNVKAPLFMMQKAAACMETTGQGGVIINISSMLAYGGPPDIGIYASSKAALVALSKNAANTLKRKGIRVTAINLGWALTEGEHTLQTGFHKQPENWAEAAGKKVPFGRLISPEDIAGTCAYLVSPAAAMMTGAVIDYEQMPIGTYDFHPMVERG